MDPTRFDLQRIHTASDVKELAERYDRMAQNYDDSLKGEWGWTSPEYTAEVLSRYISPRRPSPRRRRRYRSSRRGPL